MSLGIFIKCPEGLVLAAESRVTLTKEIKKKVIEAHYDNAHKIFGFGEQHNYIGAVTYGLGSIDIRTPYSFIPEFESQLMRERYAIEEFANKLSEFFQKQWKKYMPKDYEGPSMNFVIGGFNENEPYGSVYLMNLPHKPKPVKQMPKQNEFGITWGGQKEIVERLLRGYDDRILEITKDILQLDKPKIEKLKNEFRKVGMQVPYNILSLQDSIDLAILFLNTTIESQRLAFGIRGCGGPIDIATITRSEGFKFIQQKIIHGEHSE